MTTLDIPRLRERAVLHDPDTCMSVMPRDVLTLIAMTEQQAREIAELRAEVATFKIGYASASGERNRLLFEARHDERDATIATLRAALAEALDLADEVWGSGPQRARIAALKELTK